MEGLGMQLMRVMNVANLRMFLLPAGWTENRRHGFILSPSQKYPWERYWIADPARLILHRKIIFTPSRPYVPGMKTWEEIWSAPWDRLTFGPTGEIGERPQRRRSSKVAKVEQNATGAEAPVDVASK